MGEGAAGPHESNAYEYFILVLTVLSLLFMALLLLPLSEATDQLLLVYDNLICVVFLFDFGLRMKRAKSKRGYFIGERGWLDLLGSVPSLGFFQYTAVLRLARLSRLARITRLMREQKKGAIFRDLLENRGQYAAFFTVMLAFVVLSLGSILVLQFEHRSPDANITTGGQALWWGIVTLTTVGYGDFFPVTWAGRVTAAVVMIAGVGIIASLASILASVLIPQPKTPEAPPSEEPVPAPAIAGGGGGDAGELRRQLDEIRDELRLIRAAQGPAGSGDPPGP
jgi:voltage-gated potassium channel